LQKAGFPPGGGYTASDMQFIPLYVDIAHSSRIAV